LKRWIGKGTLLTVQARIIVLLSALALIFLVYLAWSARNEQSQVAAFTQDRDNQFSAHFSQILTLFQKPLHIVVYEYSLWDEMVDFVKKKDKQWANENVDFLLRQYGLTAVRVFDPERLLVYAADSAEGNIGELGFTEKMRQRLFSSGPTCHFFLPTNRGLLEVFGSKIQPTGDNQRTSPAKGYLFVGRLWIQEVTSELGRLTQSTVVLTLAQKGILLRTDCIGKRENGFFTLVQPLTGWDGKPVACLSVRNDTPLMPQMKAFADREFLLSIAFVCLTLALLSVSLWSWVSKPLAAISRSLNEENSHAIIHLLKSRNEFGQISKLIEQFFMHKKSLIEEVERRKRAETQLRISGEHLEQRVAERTEALSKSSLLLRSLASQLLLAEERERRRIADDLHDHIGQILVMAKLRAQQLEEFFQDSQSLSLLAEIQKLLAETLNYSRSLTAQLSPPILREFGFEAAVKSLASEFEREYGISISVEDDTTARITDDQIGVLLYRSVRELLTNVIKHSQATAVKIIFAARGDHIVTVVEDNGFGFISDLTNDISETKKFGLFSIKERLTYLGGEMEIESAPGRGAKVFLLVPAALVINGGKRREDGEH
jgi:signal transduction histidine kinase